MRVKCNFQHRGFCKFGLKCKFQHSKGVCRETSSKIKAASEVLKIRNVLSVWSHLQLWGLQYYEVHDWQRDIEESKK